MPKKHRVTLTDSEREHLLSLIFAGEGSARRLTHARLLLKADEGPSGPAWADDEIVQDLDVSRPTIERIRRRCATEGLEDALNHRRPEAAPGRKLDGHAEAHLIALACRPAPEGYNRWTLRLLADKVVALEIVDAVSHETVRQVLKKTTAAKSARVGGRL
jgi:hypothetical protein